jgi:hypothetical protein
MPSGKNIRQILPNGDRMLQSIIIDKKNDTYDSDLVESQVSKSKYVESSVCVCVRHLNTIMEIRTKCWSERSACAALGCWHKQRWPLF